MCTKSTSILVASASLIQVYQNFSCIRVPKLDSLFQVWSTEQWLKGEYHFLNLLAKLLMIQPSMFYPAHSWTQISQEITIWVFVHSLEIQTFPRLRQWMFKIPQLYLHPQSLNHSLHSLADSSCMLDYTACILVVYNYTIWVVYLFILLLLTY